MEVLISPSPTRSGALPRPDLEDVEEQAPGVDLSSGVGEIE